MSWLCTRQALPRCPHCGHTNSHFDTDDLPLDDDETDTVDCEACEKYYEVTCNVQRTYTTRAVKSDGGENV